MANVISTFLKRLNSPELIWGQISQEQIVKNMEDLIEKVLNQYKNLGGFAPSKETSSLISRMRAAAVPLNRRTAVDLDVQTLSATSSMAAQDSAIFGESPKSIGDKMIDSLSTMRSIFSTMATYFQPDATFTGTLFGKATGTRMRNAIALALVEQNLVTAEEAIKSISDVTAGMVKNGSMTKKEAINAMSKLASAMEKQEMITDINRAAALAAIEGHRKAIATTPISEQPKVSEEKKPTAQKMKKPPAVMGKPSPFERQTVKPIKGKQ